MVRIRFGMILPALFFGWAVAHAVAADPAKAAAELRGQFSTDIEALAKWCEANGLVEEAQKTRRTLAPQDPYKLFLPVLPREIGPAELSKDAPANVVEWNSRWNRLRRDYATSLFEMARRAVRSGRAAMAFEMALVALHVDPDYEPARRLFGYQKFREQWCTAYEAKRLRAGFVWSDKFGWISKSYLRRYEEGQRFTDGRWISAAEDAKKHGNIGDGWQIETEHYSIRTNHSLEAGVALGVKLERLERLWQQIFVRYSVSEADVLTMFEGRNRASAAPARHKVVYFRDRSDYNDTLREVLPNVEMTLGVYRDSPPCAYFFAGDESDDRTLYHEATHQLFHESRPIAPEVGRAANFWIIEGIALYMESLREQDGFYVLGGFEDERLHAAAYRLLHDDFYVPFVQFTGYGLERFQSDPHVATLYSQAAGQANFLVYYDGGRYRDALVSYLVAVYSGHDDPNALQKLTGVSFGELDKQYREFISAGAKPESPAVP